MNTLTDHHLNEDEFADLLIGCQPSASAAAHLEACESCRVEVGQFDVAVNEFSQATLGWSNAQPEPQIGARVRPAQSQPHRLFPALSWALAALLLFGLMVPATLHFEHARDEENAALSASDQADDSPEQISQDDALMAAVNDQLSQSEAALLAQHGWQSNEIRTKAGRPGRRQ